MEVLPLVPFIVCVISAIAIIRPLPRLWLPNRKRACLVLLVSFIAFVIAVPKKEDGKPAQMASANVEKPQATDAAARPVRAATGPASVKEPLQGTVKAIDLYAEYRVNEMQAEIKFKKQEAAG